MCGIGGIVNAGGLAGSSVDTALLRDSLEHRGRFGRGCYVGECVSLHSARHAVIALAEADQPLLDVTGEFVLVGNGGVYNYRDLAARLGSDRRSRLRPGDLQVALELFAAHGAAAFEELRGPFALAVWDRTRKRLTITRDRLGERPLYYYDNGTEFVFASEVRCLEAVLAGQLTHDDVSLLSFIGLGRTMADRTMYWEIRALPPGAVLQVDMRRGTRAWQQLSPVSSLRDADSGSPGDEEVLALLDQATSRALVADSPVAVGFSGGIDSSVVLKAALEKAHLVSAITVFSPLTPRTDENLRRARAVAELLGVTLLEIPFVLPPFDATLGVLHATLDLPAVRVSNDSVRYMAQPRDFTSFTLEASERACLDLAISYCDSGFLPILDGVYADFAFLDSQALHFQRRGCHLIVISLVADLADLVERNNLRDPLQRIDEERLEQLHASYQVAGIALPIRSKLPEEVCDDILDIIEQQRPKNTGLWFTTTRLTCCSCGMARPTTRRMSTQTRSPWDCRVAAALRHGPRRPRYGGSSRMSSSAPTSHGQWRPPSWPLRARS